MSTRVELLSFVKLFLVVFHLCSEEGCGGGELGGGCIYSLVGGCTDGCGPDFFYRDLPEKGSFDVLCDRLLI